MKLDEMERRVTALRKGNYGAALVMLNADSTWTAAWGIPQRLRSFPTQEEAVLHIQKVTADETPLIIIDL